MNSELFDSEAYFSKKKQEGWQSWAFIILGAMILLDSGTAFPFPVTGLPSLLLGGGLLAWGYRCYQNYQALPIHEALQLGKQNQGRLTRSDLFLQLRLTPKETDQVLEILIREGFIEALMEDIPQDQEIIYRLLNQL